MATENIMMDAVKAGGDRQELHELVRQHSMAAGKVVKEEGKPNDLIERIANDPKFGLTKEEIEKIVEENSDYRFDHDEDKDEKENIDEEPIVKSENEVKPKRKKKVVQEDKE